MFRTNKSRRDVMKETSWTHRENLRMNLQRRMESAKSRGDMDLLRKLEEESEYLG
ncbi:arginine synthesis PII-interacting regulator PirA [Leptolyngbya sp. AN02str]|uniref:arginine synthesis PII-interacting regulator PirA n=1 Tax=Leptolyngbya sp. AN02str TaxID=3423363 RepID=UPI003D31E051